MRVSGVGGRQGQGHASEWVRVEGAERGGGSEGDQWVTRRG